MTSATTEVDAPTAAPIRGPSATFFRLNHFEAEGHVMSGLHRAVLELFSPAINDPTLFAEARKKAMALIASYRIPDEYKTGLVRKLDQTLITAKPITNGCFIIRQERAVKKKTTAMHSDETEKKPPFPWVYAYFERMKDFDVWFETLPPEKRIFHEVRKVGLPIKAGFDVDGGPDHMQPMLDKCPRLAKISTPTLRTHLKDWLVGKILSVLAKDYGHVATEADLAISDSSNETKFSLHVAVGKRFFFSSDTQAREFQTRVFEAASADPEVALLDDKCCMAPFSSLRMPGCSKVGDVSRVINPIGCTAREATLGRTSGVALKDVTILDRESYQTMAMPEGLLSEMMRLITGCMDMSNFTLRGLPGTFMTFDRSFPSHCPMCKRHHDSEGFYAYLVGNDVKISCFASKRTVTGPNADGAISIGKIPYTPVAIQAMMCQEAHRLSNGTAFPPIPGAVIYDADDMRDYDFGDAKTMLIRAPMGIGKTKALIRYLEKVKPTRVLVISPRISFSEEMMTKIPSLRDYRSVPSNQKIDMFMAEFNHVVVQLESCHRIRCVEGVSMPDLLILDESESIISQMQNTIMTRMGTTRSVWATFEYLVRGSAKVIALDAYLGQRTMDVLSLRTGPTVAQINRTPALSEKVFALMDRNHQQVLIRQNLRDGKKVVFVCTSRKYAIAVHDAIKHQMPEKKLMIFHGQKHMTAKQAAKENAAVDWSKAAGHTGKGSKEIQKEEEEERARTKSKASVQEAWDGWDLLIYTSTITVGASFEKIHYDVLHAYFHSCSATAMEGMQMLGRVRDISSRTYCLSFSDGSMQTVPTLETIEKQIEDTYRGRTEELTKVDAMVTAKAEEAISKFDIRRIMAELAPNVEPVMDPSRGELFPVLKKDLFYKVYTANLRARYASRRQFVWTICNYILEYGGNVLIDDSLKSLVVVTAPIEAIPACLKAGVMTPLEADLILTKEDIGAHNVTAQYAAAKAIAEADEITDEHFTVMKLTPMNEKEKNEYQKHELRHLYGMNEAKLTPEWVLTYSNPKVISVWINLRLLAEGDTYRDSIEGIRAHALFDAMHKHPLEIVDAPARWIQISSAFELLKVLGFDLYGLKSFESLPTVQSLTLISSLSTILREFFTARLEVLDLDSRLKKSIKVHLAKKDAEIPFATGMKWLNAVIGAVLGLTAKKPSRSPSAWMTFQSDYFAWNGTRYLPISLLAFREKLVSREIALKHEASLVTIDLIERIRDPTQKEADSLSGLTQSILARSFPSEPPSIAVADH